jgi:hypothetical protein
VIILYSNISEASAIIIQLTIVAIAIPGPVSAALFVSHEEGQRDGFVEEILAQQVDIDTIRRRVDLHLVWPRSPPTKVRVIRK